MVYAERACDYVAGADFQGFAGSVLLQDAVIRCLEVIGEAAGKIPESVRDRAPEIPWGQIRATRNILVHRYGAVDLEIVWLAVTERLPELIVHLKALLSDKLD